MYSVALSSAMNMRSSRVGCAFRHWSLGVRRSSETALAVQAAMNLRPGQSL
jgi:hypothetical protein